MKKINIIYILLISIACLFHSCGKSDEKLTGLIYGAWEKKGSFMGNAFMQGLPEKYVFKVPDLCKKYYTNSSGSLPYAYVYDSLNFYIHEDTLSILNKDGSLYEKYFIEKLNVSTLKMTITNATYMNNQTYSYTKTNK